MYVLLVKTQDTCTVTSILLIHCLYSWPGLHGRRDATSVIDATVHKPDSAGSAAGPSAKVKVTQPRVSPVVVSIFRMAS